MANFHQNLGSQNDFDMAVLLRSDTIIYFVHTIPGSGGHKKNETKIKRRGVFYSCAYVLD
jgi:hypothetical protein